MVLTGISSNLFAHNTNLFYQTAAALGITTGGGGGGTNNATLNSGNQLWNLTGTNRMGAINAQSIYITNGALQIGNSPNLVMTFDNNQLTFGTGGTGWREAVSSLGLFIYNLNTGATNLFLDVNNDNATFHSGVTATMFTGNGGLLTGLQSSNISGLFVTNVVPANTVTWFSPGGPVYEAYLSNTLVLGQVYVWVSGIPAPTVGNTNNALIISGTNYTDANNIAIISPNATNTIGDGVIFTNTQAITNVTFYHHGANPGTYVQDKIYPYISNNIVSTFSGFTSNLDANGLVGSVPTSSLGNALILFTNSINSLPLVYSNAVLSLYATTNQEIVFVGATNGIASGNTAVFKQGSTNGYSGWASHSYGDQEWFAMAAPAATNYYLSSNTTNSFAVFPYNTPYIETYGATYSMLFVGAGHVWGGLDTGDTLATAGLSHDWVWFNGNASSYLAMQGETNRLLWVRGSDSTISVSNLAVKGYATFTNNVTNLQNLQVNGTISGNGSGLTGFTSNQIPGLSASNITSGIFTGDGSGLTNVSSTAFNAQAGNSIFGNGFGSSFKPTFTTNGSYIANTITAQQFVGGGGSLTALNAANLSGTVPTNNLPGTLSGWSLLPTNAFAGGFLLAGGNTALGTNLFSGTSNTFSGKVYVTGGLADLTGTFPSETNIATVVQMIALSNAIPAANLSGVVVTNNLPSGLAALAENNGINLTNISTFPQGITQIGGSSGMNATPNGGVGFYMNGSTAGYAIGGDHPFWVADMSTNNQESGPQFGLATMGQNGSGLPFVLSVNSMDFAWCPVNRTPSIVPGVACHVFNVDNEYVAGYYVGGPGIAQLDPGNGSIFYADFMNSSFDVPIPQPGVYQPKDITFTISQTNIITAPAFGDIYSNSVSGLQYQIAFVNNAAGYTLCPFINPNYSGTLTKSSGGTGDATITYTATTFSSVTGVEPLVFKFTVTGITTTPAVGQTYKCPPYSYTYTVASTSVSGGNGSINLSLNTRPPTSGTLTRLLGSGDSTITYGAIVSTNTWVNAFSVTPANGVVSITNTLNIGSNMVVDYGNPNTTSQLGSNVFDVVGGLHYLNGSMIDPNSVVNTTNLIFGVNGGVRYSLKLSGGNSDLSLYTSSGGEMFRFGSVEGGDSYFNIWENLNFVWHNDGGGNIGAPAGSSGNGVGRPANVYIVNTNNCGVLVIGSYTNMPSFTLVQTNYIDSKLYTNQTGRNILVVMPCTVTTGTGVGGNATYALTVGGVIKDVFSIGTLATSLLMPYTNKVSYIVTNGGVFAGTNLSTGLNSTAAIVPGGYYEIH